MRIPFDIEVVSTAAGCARYVSRAQRPEAKHDLGQKTKRL
jgi:hypothetical protein